MSSWLPVACLLTPMLTAVVVFGSPRKRALRGYLSITGAVVLLLLAIWQLLRVSADGALLVQPGGWEAPFGITLVADNLAAMLVLATAAIAVAITAFSLHDIDEPRAAAGFDGFLHIVLTGVVGAFLTGDVFNLYVWFEVMLIGSFALMTLGAGKRQLDGAVKYIALNLVSTVLMLTAIGLLHGMAGTLNIADLHQVMAARESDGLGLVVGALFLVAFGIKAAVFPVFSWLPASYHTVPITVSALFAALMTKVGIYALLRIGTLVFGVEFAGAGALMMALAVLTLLMGVAGALAETSLRRLAAWQVMISVGFLLLGVALGTPAGLAAALFYFVHGMLAKAALLMIIGLGERVGIAERLADSGGVASLKPWLAAAYLLTALSLAGIPPTAGFWAKLAFVEAGLGADAGTAGTVLIVALVVASLLGLLPLMRVWNEAFCKPAPTAVAGAAAQVPTATLMHTPAAAIFALVVLVGTSAVIGLWPTPLQSLADSAAAGISAPAEYVEVVLGSSVEEDP
jgi:multicomponent Na+:H+ antiporter subunit D